jgi:hypothetical protein
LNFPYDEQGSAKGTISRKKNKNIFHPFKNPPGIFERSPFVHSCIHFPEEGGSPFQAFRIKTNSFVLLYCSPKNPCQFAPALMRAKSIIWIAVQLQTWLGGVILFTGSPHAVFGQTDVVIGLQVLPFERGLDGMRMRELENVCRHEKLQAVARYRQVQRPGQGDTLVLDLYMAFDSLQRKTKRIEGGEQPSHLEEFTYHPDGNLRECRWTPFEEVYLNDEGGLRMQPFRAVKAQVWVAPLAKVQAPESLLVMERHALGDGKYVDVVPDQWKWQNFRAGSGEVVIVQSTLDHNKMHKYTYSAEGEMKRMETVFRGSAADCGYGQDLVWERKRKDLWHIHRSKERASKKSERKFADDKFGCDWLVKLDKNGQMEKVWALVEGKGKQLLLSYAWDKTHRQLRMEFYPEQDKRFGQVLECTYLENGLPEKEVLYWRHGGDPNNPAKSKQYTYRYF